MKKFTFIYLLLIMTKVYCQNSLEVIIPTKTYHFDREWIDKYTDGEGGDLGLLLSYTIDRERLLNTTLIGGVFRNSYGDASFTLMYGKTCEINKSFSIIAAFGMASGYEKAYRLFWRDDMGQLWYDEDNDLIDKLGFLEPLGLLPTYSLSIKYETRPGIGMILNINHAYANIGLTIDITKIIKK